MVERATVDYRDKTPFDESKLQDLQTIKDAILHKQTGKAVRAPIAQIPDALIRALQDGTDIGQLGAIAEIIAARGNFETLGIHETAQDNGIQTNAAGIVNANSSAAYAVNLAKQAASGSPRGAFANISELKSKYPNGASGIYVTKNNGHWWFYSNGWVDGGAYQTASSNFSSLKSLEGNLLEKTSNGSQTFEISNKNVTTTSSNGLKLQLDKGRTYAYSINILKDIGVTVRQSAKGIRSDGTVAWSFLNNTKGNGRKFMAINVPDMNVDHVEIGVILDEQTNGSYNIDLAGESLICARYAYPWLSNPDELNTNQNMQTFYDINQCSSILNLLFSNQSNINLISGSSASLSTFTGSGWGGFSQLGSTGYNFYACQKNATYTYSATIDQLPNVPIHLNVVGIDDSGKTVFVKGGQSITQTGRHSLTFTTPNQDIDYLKFSLSFFNNEAGTYSVRIGAEKLTINGDAEYSPSYDTYTLQELSDKLYQALFNDDNIHYTDIPFVNLLEGTSDEMVTYSAKSYGNITTALNSNNFVNIVKGATYCYRITIDKLPSIPLVLEVSGFNASNNNIWIIQQPVISAGDNAVTFEASQDTARLQCSVVFPQKQDELVEVTVGKEKLSLSNYDSGYSKKPALESKAIKDALREVSKSVQDSNFLQKNCQ